MNSAANCNISIVSGGSVSFLADRENLTREVIAAVMLAV